MELESYIPELGLVPKFIRPVRPVADLYDLLVQRLCYDAVVTFI